MVYLFFNTVLLMMGVIISPATTQNITIETPPPFVQLQVPFVWEIPDGLWIAPWSGACEEASAVMIDAFYHGETVPTLNKQQQKKRMSSLFTWENKKFGSNTDTDAHRTAMMINANTQYRASVVYNPTIDAIRAELRAGHPVISLHYGFDLYNPQHRFRRGGSSYHVMAVVGYDDVKNEFIVNDNELRNGRAIRYSYDIFMNSLHDFNHTTHKADGAPVVLFSAPRLR